MKLNRIIYNTKLYSHLIRHSIKVLSNMNKQPKILYFGVTMHSNLGDLAQCNCIRKFFKEKYPEYKVIEIESIAYMNKYLFLRKKMKQKVNKNDLIFFQSGYCTTDLGGIEDLMHQAVIEDFPDNRLIIMPQTIYFKSKERENQASLIYNSHKHMLFLARDRISYEKAKQIFPNISIKEFPDIVTTMIGQYNFKNEKKGILFCLRNDLEKFYSNDEIEKLKNNIEKNEKVNIMDTTISKKINANSKNLEKYILEYIESLSKYKIVVTDRYHGTIFSLIANTPVIVIKTKDHKVVTGVDWFKGIYDDSVYYIDNINDVPEKIAEILKRKNVLNNQSYFKREYYDKLPKIIENELY